ncbi:MAG: hypothetical protein EZS28_049979, partial [Streblomastix strix]
MKASNDHEDFVITKISQDVSLIGLYIPSKKIGIIRIITFQPDDIDEFQYSFYEIVRSFADRNNPLYAKKLIIDLRYNTGGYTRLAPFIFRFLFPNADSPIWPPADLVKAPINEITRLFEDFFIKQDPDNEELFLDEVTGDIIHDYYQQEGLQRTTTIGEEVGLYTSITVDLTKRATYYAGHLDKIKNYSLEWNLFRSTHWQKKDVVVIVNGQSISTSAIFAQ